MIVPSEKEFEKQGEGRIVLIVITAIFVFLPIKSACISIFPQKNVLTHLLFGIR